MRAILPAILIVAGCAAAGRAPVDAAGPPVDAAMPGDPIGSITFTTNGQAVLDAPVGTNLTFAWSSDGVLAMRSEVAIDGGHDDCGNVDGPWVVDTLAGTINATLLACQGGHRYDLTLIGSTAATGELRVTDVVTVP